MQAGDQLLRVDGKSLVGITQERAADIMMHTGQVVELEVAMQVNQAGSQSAGDSSFIVPSHVCNGF